MTPENIIESIDNYQSYIDFLCNKNLNFTFLSDRKIEEIHNTDNYGELLREYGIDGIPISDSVRTPIYVGDIVTAIDNRYGCTNLRYNYIGQVIGGVGKDIIVATIYTQEDNLSVHTHCFNVRSKYFKVIKKATESCVTKDYDFNETFKQFESLLN